MYTQPIFGLQCKSPRRNIPRRRPVGGDAGVAFLKPSEFYNHHCGGKLGMEFNRLSLLGQENGLIRAASSPAFKNLRVLAGAGLALMLTACASNQNAASKPPEPVPQVVSMDEWMARAKLASVEGNAEKARAAYRSAAQNYPGEKLPWLKLAEDYFYAQDYGNAVIAAQEVLQRDMQDHFAHSVLAVSGLRLTAGSLVALRQEGSLPVGSRDEAISVARALRDTLGAASLLPPTQPAIPSRVRKPAPAPATATAAAAAAAAPGSTTPRAAVPAANGAPAIVPAVATPAAAQATARAPAAATNPFDKLK